MVDAAYHEIPYYEYYDCGVSDRIPFTSISGKTEACAYYFYTPKDTELDENTPVITYITHGGGVVDEERALALNYAASQQVEAIFVVPWTDRPDAACACVEDARKRFDGVGNFDAVSGHGTSSGGRAIIRTALESVRPEGGYGFRFANVVAYDPADETGVTSITDHTEEMKALAEQGFVLFLQTDTDSLGRRHGSGYMCNKYARVYSENGGTALVAESSTSSHEGKFIKPISHNSMNWAIGKGMLIEDDSYQNNWYYYKDGVKNPTTLDIATAILHPD